MWNILSWIYLSNIYVEIFGQDKILKKYWKVADILHLLPINIFFIWEPVQKINNRKIYI